MVKNNIAAPCGMYCGTCRDYLLLKKDLFEEKGRKSGCTGCRIRNKKCAFIRRDCPAFRKNDIEFCFECDKFPCLNLTNLDNRYKDRYHVSFIENLQRNKEIGVEKWLLEQKELYTCPNCRGDICVHDAECYDCGKKLNPNKMRGIS